MIFKINHNNIIVVIFYRPPKNNSLKEFLEDMDKILMFLVPITDYIVCLGYVNFDIFSLNNIADE